MRDLFTTLSAVGFMATTICSAVCLCWRLSDSRICGDACCGGATFQCGVGVREVDESSAHKTRTSMIIRIAVEKVIVYNISVEWDIE